LKKLIHKIKNKISNSGSGLILVIVALAFVGILTGALLTAVAYVYRLKLYDYNAKSNFYYLEQAMDEIYAGVGSQTMSEMQSAYQETREKIVYYDVKTKSYKDVGNDAANKMFKDAFMSRIANQDYFKPVYETGTTNIDYDQGIYKEIQGMISNSSVELVKEKLDVIYLNENGKPYNKADSSQVLAKVVLKNLTLKRTAEYDRSQAKGTFTQTISTDIEISRPDFDVNFNNNNLDIDNLFSFCMLADSGIEINESQGSKLTVNGNIYGASDFYNKTYNEYDDFASSKITQNDFVLTRSSDGGSSNDITYSMNKVYNRNYGSDAVTDLVNENYRVNNSANRDDYLYNGDNERSKYSGLYIDGGNVSILANYVIIPGSLSVMNAGDLTIYGRDGSEIGESNVWVDELVLAGYVPKGKNENTGVFNVAKGANAFLNANLYIKDDTQIESDSAKLKLSGGYYGYSNSSTSDERIFVPSTKKETGTNRYVYQQLVGTDDVENRGHYNSSSIIVNSENATVDLSALNTLYIAGRSYVELSHLKDGGKKTYQDTYTDDDNKEYRVDESSSTYEYDTDVDDYRTGESVSIKSTQLAYIPENAPRAVDDTGNVIADPKNSSVTVDHYECEIASVLGTSYLFQKYFGSGNQTVSVIPVIYVEDEVHKVDGTTSDKVMYYIDFDYAADNDLFDSSATSGLKAKTTANAGKYGDYLKQCFIKDYFDYINYEDAYDAGLTADIPSDVDTNILDDPDLKDVLTDVTYYEDHIAGQITIPDLSANNVRSYSSGVITNTGETLFKVNNKNEYTDAFSGTTKKVSFNVVTAKDSVIDSTLEGSTTKAFTTGTDGSKVDNTIDFSKEYQSHYNYVKWALMDLEKGSDEADIVDQIVAANGEGCITPLNRYLNFNNIMDDDPLMHFPTVGGTAQATNISPDNLDLGDYKVYVSKDDISLECKAGDNNTITGIIISEGDVYFKTKEQLKVDHPGWTDAQLNNAVCNNFNGIIITGGKIFVNHNVTSINATDLCKNIINSCMTKASLAGTSEGTDAEIAKARKEGALAIRVLSLFKAYENDASAALTKANKDILIAEGGEEETEPENEDSPLSISNIDYSDVIRYNNWMRNVD